MKSSDNSDLQTQFPMRPTKSASGSEFYSAPMTVSTSIGLSLLYASAYFLPATAAGAYFLPSRDVFSLIFEPTLAAVVVLGALACVSASLARRWVNWRIRLTSLVIGQAILVMIALKGFMSIAAYDWEDRLVWGTDLLSAQRQFKVIVAVFVLVSMWLIRRWRRRSTRALAGLGYAFAVLALFRLFFIFSYFSPVGATPASVGSIESRPETTSQRNSTRSALASKLPRRVVWAIFDESEFDRIYDGRGRSKFANFDRLAREAVFATDANSPASATLYSIPALLTGVQLGRQGMHIDKSGVLWLERSDGTQVPFDEANSIFGLLRADGRTASVLGFLHPYCKLFVLQRCDSFHWPEMGNLDSALWANVPNTVSRRLGRKSTWDKITRDTLRLLPEYVARNDALTFLHLNFPHPPATYADRVLHLQASLDPLVEYDHNLQFADQVLGRIINILEKQAPDREVLLVVSTDHWLRNMWYQVNVLDASKPIPLIVWKVGESQGAVLSQPVSTIHTSSMIMDYLDGKISTQAEIAQWWSGEPVYPSYIVPNIG